MNTATINTDVQVSLACAEFFGCISRSGLAGSCGRSTLRYLFNFLSSLCGSCSCLMEGVGGRWFLGSSPSWPKSSGNNSVGSLEVTLHLTLLSRQPAWPSVQVTLSVLLRLAIGLCASYGNRASQSAIVFEWFSVSVSRGSEADIGS